MKALAIDSASSCMIISAKNENEKVSISLDIGPRQAQEILPSIDYVLSKAKLSPKDLNYISLCKGPGTFTGLRIAFSAAKSLELAFGIPIYGVSTLRVYAEPYKNYKGTILSTIDAKKNQFFAALYKNGKEILKPQDITESELYKKIKKEKNILCVGPDACELVSLLKSKYPKLNIINFEGAVFSTDLLFKIAEEMIHKNEKPLDEYEGPEYLRKSEAELALESK